MTESSSARLALEDGSIFVGREFGDPTPRTVDGEVCFNTSLTGYQEILTDPSYAGQIITMTCPLIGNYGVNHTDLESEAIHAQGFIVRELANRVSNYRATSGLGQWLAEHGVLGISGIDTRALTRRLRTAGVMRGVLSNENLSDEDLVQRAQLAPGLVGRNLVEQVSLRQARQWDKDLGQWPPIQGNYDHSTARRLKVVTLDCGSKLNILRHLVDSGCDVTVLPFDATDKQIMDYQPRGLFVPNGPGDPAAVHATIETLRHLHGKLPIFGICLGHQLLAMSLSAKTYKLKFGHRGSNQPVQNLETAKVEITSQNHGFAVEIESLEKAGGQPTHINLNDRTLEGFRHATEPMLAVQYHPEASPGPHDSRYLFDCFIDMMDTGRSPTGRQMDEAQRRRSQLREVGTG